MARRRRFNAFSLSFLDVMSCGFGAVVLIFLIIEHSTDDDVRAVSRDLLAEIRLLDYEIESGRPDLAELRERIEELKRQIAEARRARMALVEDAERKRDEVDDLEALTIAERESLEQLKTDVETREEEVERLRAIEEENAGRSAIFVEGEGDRQYLTGLFVGGSHILIALDASASMLDASIVNILRRRNMPVERRLQSPKWQRAVRTVEWLTAQVPVDSQFQIVRFNTTVESALPSEAWYDTTDANVMSDAIEALGETPPGGGTSLENLFDAMWRMDPVPDNVFLIVDSLPTQGANAPRRATVTGRQRMSHYGDALKRLPPNVPVNVIMFPMEGDPLAPAAYWSLAQNTGGVYMSPSEDWP